MNYTSLQTCIATAENLAVRLKQKYGYPFPAAEDHPDPREHLGADASWDQRRAFEWGWLAATARFGAEGAVSEKSKQEFDEMQATCAARIAEFIAREKP